MEMAKACLRDGSPFGIERVGLDDQFDGESMGIDALLNQGELWDTSGGQTG